MDIAQSAYSSPRLPRRTFIMYRNKKHLFRYKLQGTPYIFTTNEMSKK